MVKYLFFRQFTVLLFLLFSVSAIGRTKVAVIDTGISLSQISKDYVCESGHKSFIDDSIYDASKNKHGTNIIGIIGKAINPKTHCIVSYKVWSRRGEGNDNMRAIKKSLKDIARNYDIRYLNMSMSGVDTKDGGEKHYLKRLLMRGVKVTVSAGNKKLDLDVNCKAYPACYFKKSEYDNYYVVKSSIDSTNYGGVITDTFSGYRVGTPALSGTSQASAQKMAQLLKSVVYIDRSFNGRLQ